MKSTIATVFAIGLTMAASNATTVTAGGGTTGAQFVTSAGTFLTPTNATVEVGSLSGSIFTKFAVTDASPINFGTSVALTGRWLGNFADTSAAANPFNGLQIWFKVSTTADGGGLAYFSGGQLFPNNGGGVADAITISASTLTTINADLSSVNSAAFQNNNVGTYPNGYVTIGVIPEPSAALLGALGALGLLRRRRI
jgi:hypothetical protein